MGIRLRIGFLAASLALGFAAGAGRTGSAPRDPMTLHIFYDNDIHFAPDDSSRYDTPTVRARENGRVISRTIGLEPAEYPTKILARVSIRPIPKDETSVYDKWDRAGNVRIRREEMPPIEIIKFITAYGGVSDHEVDVTDLAPILTGECTFEGFIDTWTSPGWKLDFSLTFAPVERIHTPDWVQGIVYEESLTEEKLRDGPVSVGVDIPEGTERVAMYYLVSGHCTDGRDADEFVTKDNVISIDGREGARLRPWRDDCLQFRGRNPYCRRWSDGSWSSDYSRSGWCPGDWVEPIEIDLTEFLSAGDHRISIEIENVRPKDADGQFGYWRVSSYLLGWKKR